MPRPAKKAAAKRIRETSAEEIEAVVETMEKSEETTVIDIASLRADVYKTMGMKVFTPDTKFVLKTDWPVLDSTIGTPHGIPYGRIYEFSGPECIDADTYLRFESRTQDGRRINHKGGTIKRLFKEFHHFRESRVYYIASVNEQKRIVQNVIENVIQSGVKMCYRLTTVNGYSIVATAEHRFFTGARYVRLGDLEPGMLVAIHNSTPFRVEDGAPRRNYAEMYVLHHPVAGIRRVRDRKSGAAYVYRRLKRARAVVEANMNRLPLSAYIERLNNNDLEGLKFLDRTDHVHHKDEDTTNDDLSNLEVQTASLHGVLHATQRHNNLRFTAVFDAIESIEQVGKRETYDITMRAPYHNFVANNFVVHNSHGKSVIKTILMGAAQRDGAQAIEGDIEESYDPPWFDLMGCESDSIIPVQPKMVYEPLTGEQKAENASVKAAWKTNDKKWRDTHPLKLPYVYGPKWPKRPQTAQEIFEEMEGLIKKLHMAGAEKIVASIDSIANLTTEAQIKAGMHQNMRTNTDLPTFLSGALKQWQVLAANYNVMFLFTNQIREKPGQMFGDPTYEPGGRALRHNCQSRNRVNRIGDGKVYQAGKLSGIRTAIKNKKNKTGEGSIEQQACEVIVRFDKKPMKLTDRIKVIPFVSKKEKEKMAAAEA